MSETVKLAAYDAEWPLHFQREQLILADVFEGTAALVEHIGSTAVPGMVSKPIIDIMVGVAALSLVEARISRLEEHQYEYVPEYEAQLPDRRYFRKPFIKPRSHHLHCVVVGSDFWRDHLAFRDYLRTHPDAAAAYAELKRQLASRHRSDRVAYSEGKTSFIQAIVARAIR